MNLLEHIQSLYSPNFQQFLIIAIVLFLGQPNEIKATIDIFSIPHLDEIKEVNTLQV